MKNFLKYLQEQWVFQSYDDTVPKMTLRAIIEGITVYTVLLLPTP